MDNSLVDLSQVYVTINFFEGIKILTFSLIYGFLIRFIFIKYSNSLSSKKGFGNTILLVMISTASLIAVVKSSLALSLGLVGALSVIRFRSAIKEPYNLAFILFAICISIAIGASQFSFATLITIFGSITIYCLFKYRNGFDKALKIEKLDTITLNFNSEVDLKKIYSLLDINIINYKIHSFNENEESISLIIRTSSLDISKLENLRKEIKILCNQYEINFYEDPKI